MVLVLKHLVALQHRVEAKGDMIIDRAARLIEVAQAARFQLEVFETDTTALPLYYGGSEPVRL